MKELKIFLGMGKSVGKVPRFEIFFNMTGKSPNLPDSEVLVL